MKFDVGQIVIVPRKRGTIASLKTTGTIEKIIKTMSGGGGDRLCADNLWTMLERAGVQSGRIESTET